MQWLYLPGTQVDNMYYFCCPPFWSLHLNHVAAAWLQVPFLPPQHHSFQLLVLIQNLPSLFIPVFSDTSFVLLQPIYRSISSPSNSLGYLASWCRQELLSSFPKSLSDLSLRTPLFLCHPPTYRGTLYQRPHNQHTCQILRKQQWPQNKIPTQ